MKRVMAELRSTEPNDGAPPAEPSWLERVSEKLGDSLAEPSPTHILIAILVVLCLLAAATAFVLG
jgi:hypothetical protein